VAREIVRLDEEAHAPAGLVADPGPLRVAVGLREQQPRAAALGRNDDPALAAAQRRVAHERESELAGEPGDRLVVVADNQRYRCQPVAHFVLLEGRNWSMLLTLTVWSKSAMGRTGSSTTIPCDARVRQCIPGCVGLQKTLS